MTYKAEKNEVRYKVRRMALRLREFTVKELVEATELNESSVRTEINRMMKEKLVLAEKHPEGRKGGQGRAPKLYRLTEDPKALAALSESTASFEVTPPRAGQPRSRSFDLAVHLLNRALAAEDAERGPLLKKAALRLKKAEEHEKDQEKDPHAQAHLRYQNARWFYLKRSFEKAKALFLELKIFFSGVDELEMVRHVDTYLTDLEIEHLVSNTESIFQQARCARDVIVKAEYRPKDPIVARLLSFLQNLARMDEVHEFPGQAMTFLEEMHWVHEMPVEHRVTRARILAMHYRQAVSSPKDDPHLAYLKKVLIAASGSYNLDPNEPRIATVLRREECFYLYLDLQFVENGVLFVSDLVGALLSGQGDGLLDETGQDLLRFCGTHMGVNLIAA